MRHIPPAAKAQWNEGFLDADAMYPAFGTVFISPAPRKSCQPGVLPGSWGSAPDAPLLPCQDLLVTIHMEPELLTTCTEGHREQKRARFLLTSAVM